MKSAVLIVNALVVLVAMGMFANAQTREIIVDGQNAPEWNQWLGVTATRGSCNLPPEGCMQQVEALLKSQHTRHFYMNLWDDKDPQSILDRATYYSNASLSEPRLYEVGIDDFTDHFNNWCVMSAIRCDSFLGEVIAAVKSQNKALKFGLTLYEDQLPSLLANRRFTPALRNQIDTVHMVLHQRQNGPQFESYVNEVKHKFPNAQVIAASYHYDRIDYVKCGGVRCSAAQELDFYKQTLKLQLTLLQQGVVSGIEFYPGYFGWEEKWPSWDNPKVCSPARKQDCIDNMKAMDQATLQLFKEFGIGSH